MNSIQKDAVREIFRAARVARKLTQEEAAEVAGSTVDRSFVQRIERGDVSPVSSHEATQDRARALAKAVHLEWSDVVRKAGLL